jgi:hypothetical protein
MTFADRNAATGSLSLTGAWAEALAWQTSNKEVMRRIGFMAVRSIAF